MRRALKSNEARDGVWQNKLQADRRGYLSAGYCAEERDSVQMGSQTGGSSVGAGSQVIEGEGGGGQETC
tara:strand:+ start:912 stop:1118 length:207 start_codon:yes stop_codon:yes gene_type:complete